MESRQGLQSMYPEIITHGDSIQQGCRSLSSGLLYGTYHQAVRSSLRRMGPIKDIGQLNDNIVGDRKLAKLATENSSEERGEARGPGIQVILFLSFLKQSRAERAQH